MQASRSNAPNANAAAAPLPRHWLPVVAIFAAALLAHGGCLRSTFYLDDFTQIVDTDAVDHGLWYTHGLRVVTYLTYWLTWKVGGMSAPLFHLGNLLVHTAVSLAVLGFARDYLRQAAALPGPRADRLALGAALLFAVHPLCSEIPNYVRARDIALVSLWALLGAWAVLRWRRDGRWRWLAAAGAALVLAVFTKEVGGIIAGGTLALVAYATRGPGRVRWHPATLVSAGTALVLAAVVVVVARWTAFLPLYRTLESTLTHPRLGWHVLTQSRVFWRYVARVGWPARLCSDHQVAWTFGAGDLVAWASLAGLAAVAGAALFALARSRPLSPARAAAALGVAAGLDILHRLANVTGELMVEYRMYPVMTVLCILLVWGWDRLAASRGGEGWRRGVWRVGLGLLVAGIVLSARRTLDWRDAATLSANVVAQYPLQARARQEAQEADLRAHRWQAALDRQPGIRAALDGAAAFNASHALRKYDPSLAVLTRVASEGNDAHALARLGRGREARAHLAWLRGAMESNHLAEPMYWALYYYARGQVHAAAGEKADALMDLRDSQEMIPGFEFPERERRRVERGE